MNIYTDIMYYKFTSIYQNNFKGLILVILTDIILELLGLISIALVRS